MARPKDRPNERKSLPMNAQHSKLLRLVFAALLAALCYVATLIIQVPTPTNGYVNLGDCIVLLSGWMLGPVWGFFAAGIGSMLADVLSGYAYYAPATFLIKGVMALLGVVLYRLIFKAFRHSLPAFLLSALVGEIIMVLGYFGYAALILGRGLGAAASIPGNVVQGVFGLVISTVLALLLSKTPLMNRVKAQTSAN